MTKRSSIATPCLLLVLACSEPDPEPVAPRFQLVAQLPAAADHRQTVAALVDLLAGAASTSASRVVLAHDAELAAAVRAATNAPAIRIVTLAAAAPPTNTALPFDAMVVPETGASIAVDFALLASNGIELPPQLPLGATFYTAANRLAGGTPVVAPADPIVALLRLQHAAVLTTTPATDEIHPIALVQLHDDEAWQRRVHDEAKAAAARYPQLAWQSASANGDRELMQQLVRDFAKKGCHAILVSAAGTKGLAQLAAEVREQSITLILLDPQLTGDPGACCIGSHAPTIGRALALAIQQVRPAGTDIIELLGERATSAAGQDHQAQEHQGLLQALGLR